MAIKLNHNEIVKEYYHLHKGYTPIMKKYHISRSTLNRWKNEYDHRSKKKNTVQRITPNDLPKLKLTDNDRIQKQIRLASLPNVIKKKVSSKEEIQDYLKKEMEKQKIPSIPVESKKRKKKKLKLKLWVILLLIFIFASILLFSIVKILEWNQDNHKTNEIIEDLQPDIIEVEDSNQTVVVNPPEVKDDSNPYWNYIKMNLMNVNFTDLVRKNSDTVGWIYVGGTNINYPVVKTKDNKYYLTHSYNKDYNTAGWVFMDYRNHLDELDQNTIIYAHGRYDKTMFGTLKNIGTNGWLNQTANYIIKLSTLKQNSLWQIFSFYIIPNTSDYLTTNFNSPDDYISFLNLLKNRSTYNFNTTLNEKDKIITLSTCYDDYKKVVMHAKLIKLENK